MLKKLIIPLRYYLKRSLDFWLNFEHEQFWGFKAKISNVNRYFAAYFDGALVKLPDCQAVLKAARFSMKGQVAGGPVMPFSIRRLNFDYLGDDRREAAGIESPARLEVNQFITTLQTLDVNLKPAGAAGRSNCPLSSNSASKKPSSSLVEAWMG